MARFTTDVEGTTLERPGIAERLMHLYADANRLRLPTHAAVIRLSQEAFDEMKAMATTEEDRPQYLGGSLALFAGTPVVVDPTVGDDIVMRWEAKA